jgi:hypothetical protein
MNDEIRASMDVIATSAEMAENAVLPTIHEVHADPERQGACPDDLPAALREPAGSKSPARWAYERLILYIQNFEKQLDKNHQVAMGFTGGDAGVIRIEGMGYFDPDLITFYGSNDGGAKTQLIQHVSQLNVMLTAMPVTQEQDAPERIGFRLARDLEQKVAATK